MPGTGAGRAEAGGSAPGEPTSGSRNARLRCTGPGGVPPVRSHASNARSRHHSAPPAEGGPGSAYQRTDVP